MTTDYNGGFASVRSQPWGGWLMLERARGLKMMVRGDGRSYKINAKRCWGPACAGLGCGPQLAPFGCPANSQRGPGCDEQPLPRRDDQFDGIQYQHDFVSPAGGEWQEVVLPFERFKPNFRGQVVPGRPPLQGSQVGRRHPPSTGRGMSVGPLCAGGSPSSSAARLVRVCWPQVRQVGLMISKFSDGGGYVPNFRSGSFRLAIKWIKGIV